MPEKARYTNLVTGVTREAETVETVRLGFRLDEEIEKQWETAPDGK